MICANVLNTQLIFVLRHAGLRAHAVGDVLLVESANFGVLVCAVLLTFGTLTDTFYEIIREYCAILQVIFLPCGSPTKCFDALGLGICVILLFSDNLAYLMQHTNPAPPPTPLIRLLDVSDIEQTLV